VSKPIPACAGILSAEEAVAGEEVRGEAAVWLPVRRVRPLRQPLAQFARLEEEVAMLQAPPAAAAVALRSRACVTR
jgi:hypothetical protein